MIDQLTLTDDGDPAIEEAIATLLSEYNDSQSGPGNAKALVIAIRDA